ncbi:hisE [Symbiodinium sp. CCMP2456]|nr:hisE [Symbiodinium sp. CCMP2456]
MPAPASPASRPRALCSAVAPVRRRCHVAPLVAFSGGLNLGNADTWAVSPPALASTWSGMVFGIELVSQVHRAGFTSLGQLALAAPPSAVDGGSAPESESEWPFTLKATSLGALRERLGLEVEALICLDVRIGGSCPLLGRSDPNRARGGLLFGEVLSVATFIFNNFDERGPMACTVATVNMLSAAETVRPDVPPAIYPDTGDLLEICQIAKNGRGPTLPPAERQPSNMTVMDVGRAATYGAINSSPTISTLTLLSGKHETLQAELQKTVDALVEMNPVLSGRVWQKDGRVLLEPKAHKEFLRVYPMASSEAAPVLEGLDLKAKIRLLQSLEGSLCSPMDGRFTLGHGSQVFLVELMAGKDTCVVAVHLSHIVGDIKTLYELVGQMNALMRGETPLPLVWDSDWRLSFDLFPDSVSEKDRKNLRWGILGWLCQKLCGPRRNCSVSVFSKAQLVEKKRELQTGAEKLSSNDVLCAALSRAIRGSEIMNLAVNLRKKAEQHRIAGNFWQTVALDHDAAKDPNIIRKHLPKLQFFKTDGMPFWPYALGRYSFVTNWTACTCQLSIPGLDVHCHLPHSNFLKEELIESESCKEGAAIELGHDGPLGQGAETLSSAFVSAAVGLTGAPPRWEDFVLRLREMDPIKSRPESWPSGKTIKCHQEVSKPGFERLDRLWRTIQERKVQAQDAGRSWTARLLAKGPDKCAQKVGEEATEVCIEAAARRPGGVVKESADLLFHLLVLWASMGIEPKEVLEELARREGISGVEEKESRSR